MASSRFNLPWPLILYVAGVMFLDWWLNEYSWWLSTRMKLHPSLSVGNVFGQIGMVVMVGGLWGRTWLAGWLFASSLVIAAFSILFICSSSPFGTDQWGVLFIMPLVVLGGCLPLMVLRNWRGWSLTRSDQLELPKTNSRVEDLFIFSIAVACAIALTKVSFVPTGPMPGAELIALAYGAGYSLPFILPVAIATFVARNWRQRLVGYALIIASVIGAVGLFAMALEWTMGNNGFQLFVDFLLIMPTCILVWFLGIAALLGSGYRVTYYTRKPSVDAESAVDPLAKEEPETTQPSSFNLSQRQAALATRGTVQARWLALGLGTLTLFSVFSGSLYDYYEIQRFTAQQDPSAYFQAPVERIDYRGRQIFGVTMAATATAADVEHVAARVPELSRLSVAGTQLGDDDMAVFDKFTNLTELDLSKTPVTGKGLDHLKKMESLSLADTQVTFAEAMRFTNLKTVGKLDLSGLNITDDQLINDNYTNNFFQGLILARNPITDSGLAVLLERVTVSSLDLSDTKVIGQPLESSNSLMCVKLDGTEVTDAVLLKLIANPNCPCQQLSLRRTKITAAVLPALINHSVALGQGAITESDLMNLTGASFQQLRLNGPEFTGESLTTGKIRVQSIDFSGSSVTDDVLQRLTILGWIQYLKLSNTSITNKGIERLNVSEMDLRDLKIDTTSLLEKMSNMVFGRILLRHETVTPQQRVKARHSRISWDEVSYGHEW